MPLVFSLHLRLKQQPPAFPIAENVTFGPEGAGENLAVEIEMAQCSQNVRREIDARADFAQFRRLLTDRHFDSGADASCRGGQAAKPRADDRDFWAPRHRHVPTIGPGACLRTVWTEGVRPAVPLPSAFKQKIKAEFVE